MPDPAELPARQQASIIGRDAARARVRGLVDPVPQSSQVLLVTGEAGMGKTVLLAEAAERARSSGIQVLSAIGRESETRLAYAGLHQLLRPELGSAASLPGRQSQALMGAFGLTADPAAAGLAPDEPGRPDLAVGLSERSPVSWWPTMPNGSTAARSRCWPSSAAAWTPSGSSCWSVPAGRPAPRLRPGLPGAATWAAVADDACLPCWTGSSPSPWSGQAAGARPSGRQSPGVDRTVHGDRRRPGCEQAMGGRAAAPDRSAQRGDDGPVRRPAVPGASSAAAGRRGRRPGPAGSRQSGRRAGCQALAPAEQLGLVTVNRTGLQFSHPLVRSAIYHSAPFAQRAVAHRQLAEALRDQPDRRAWHLAAAALQPDEQVASLLEATAAQAQQRGGAAAAALALERAAELSPDPAEQARRLVAAATAAVPTGQGEWVQDSRARSGDHRSRSSVTARRCRAGR